MANVEWDSAATPHKITIKIDAHQDGRTKLILHELMHYILHEDLDIVGNLSDDIEEAIAEGIGGLLWGYVDSDSRRTTWWRRALAEKLTPPSISINDPTRTSITSSPVSKKRVRSART
jgi:hypothetical protein